MRVRLIIVARKVKKAREKSKGNEKRSRDEV